MRRLREELDSLDPATARAAALLAAAPPLDTERLWRRSLPGLPAVSRRKPVVMRGALVLALSLASVVATAATVPRVRWWNDAWTTVHSVFGPVVPESMRQSDRRLAGAGPLPLLPSLGLRWSR